METVMQIYLTIGVLYCAWVHHQLHNVRKAEREGFWVSLVFIPMVTLFWAVFVFVGLFDEEYRV